VALLLCANGGTFDAGLILLLILVLFFPLLVHELGHSFMMRRYGIRSHIVLYWLGGLAIPGSGSSSPWDVSSSWERPQRRGPWQQIAISFAGPAAGFILAAVTILVIVGTGGQFQLLSPEEIFRGGGFWRFGLSLDYDKYQNLYHTIDYLLYFNIFWGLVNLLPVYPLDGGQIARELFLMTDPWEGVAKSLMTSMIVGGVVGLAGFMSGQTFVGFLFLSLAYSSYAAWQQMRHGGGGRPW
jgi:Zn-dependent protease